MTPAAILAKALESFDDLAICRLARLAGVTPDNAQRAAHGSKGRPAHVNDYLRLCAVIGLDPFTGQRSAPWQPADLQATMLAIALRMKRGARGHNIRVAAKQMGISFATLSRLENSNPRSFEIVLAACKYTQVDPSHYVKRETLTGNQLIARADRRSAA
mgnify:CR=1 FL=1